MECLWVNMMIGSKLCLAENRKLARSKWGAGIDTPKYSGIRKMSEVVVRVNNAWPGNAQLFCGALKNETRGHNRTRKQ